MPTKFTRERYKEVALEKLRDMDRPSMRSAPRNKTFMTFLVVYVGVAAYMTLGMFLDKTMNAEPREERTITAPAVVIERGDEAVQRDPDVYAIVVEVSPEDEAAFKHTVYIDEESWLHTSVGDAMTLRYERVGEDRHVLLLNVYAETDTRDSIELAPMAEPEDEGVLLGEEIPSLETPAP